MDRRQCYRLTNTGLMLALRIRRDFLAGLELEQIAERYDVSLPEIQAIFEILDDQCMVHDWADYDCGQA